MKNDKISCQLEEVTMIQLSSVSGVVNIVVTHRWWHDDTANKSTNDNADKSTNSFADESTKSFSTTSSLKDWNHDEMKSYTFKQAEKVSQNAANCSEGATIGFKNEADNCLHGLHSGNNTTLKIPTLVFLIRVEVKSSFRKMVAWWVPWNERL